MKFLMNALEFGRAFSTWYSSIPSGRSHLAFLQDTFIQGLAQGRIQTGTHARATTGLFQAQLRLQRAPKFGKCIAFRLNFCSSSQFAECIPIDTNFNAGERSIQVAARSEKNQVPQGAQGQSPRAYGRILERNYHPRRGIWHSTACISQTLHQAITERRDCPKAQTQSRQRRPSVHAGLSRYPSLCQGQRDENGERQGFFRVLGLQSTCGESHL